MFMMYFYYHAEGQNNGLLGVFVSRNKGSRLLICGSVLRQTGWKIQIPLDESFPPNEKRDSAPLNRIWKIPFVVGINTSGSYDMAEEEIELYAFRRPLCFIHES